MTINVQVGVTLCSYVGDTCGSGGVVILATAAGGGGGGGVG